MPFIFIKKLTRLAIRKYKASKTISLGYICHKTGKKKQHFNAYKITKNLGLKCCNIEPNTSNSISQKFYFHSKLYL